MILPVAVEVRPWLLEVRHELPAALESAAEARRLLRGALVSTGRHHLVDTAELVLSEVVTNATLHAHTPVELWVGVGEDEVYVEVRDFNPTLPVQRDYDLQATTGRGMALVATLASACGAHSLGEDGKVVWFCVSTDPVTATPDELLAAWDIDGLVDELDAADGVREVVLLSFPATLWLSTRQHHDALLREFVLYQAAHDSEPQDLAAADVARAIISTAVTEAVERAHSTGTAEPALPDGHPSPLPWVPKKLDLRIAVPADASHVFATLQDVLDSAERLAVQEQTLLRPALPELTAVRDWVCEQVIAQLAGNPPSPWPGTDQERFEREFPDRTAPSLPPWDSAAVTGATTGVIAADDANRIVAISTPLAMALGWDPADIVGRRVVTLIPPAFREAHVAGFSRHLSTGEAHVLGVPLDLPVLCKDGSELRCRFLIERAPLSRGRAVYLAWIDPLVADAETTDPVVAAAPVGGRSSADDDRESARLAAVHSFDILDTPPDGAFDRIAALAARACNAPIAVVSVVDTDRIWFKARHGLPDVEEIAREPGLCASAILQDGPWVVSDASTDPRTLTNSLVAGEFGLRFYAGVPLTTSDGFNLGTVCVLDTEPREATADEIATLQDLAALVVSELELRLASRRTVQAESDLRRDAQNLAAALQSSLLPPTPPAIPGMELATRYLPGDSDVDVGGDFFDVFRLGPNDWAVVLGDACGKGPKAAGVAALARWSVRASAVHHFEPHAVLNDLNTVLWTEGGAEDDRFGTVVFSRLELDTCGAWVTLASGGHPLPMLVRRNGVVEERGRPGLPMGMFENAPSIDDRVGLGPGDALVFFTDGITESRSQTGDLYGEDRLREALSEVAGSDAGTIATAVVRAARRFGTGQRDDVAIVVLRVPDDLGDDPLQRVLAATGLGPEAITLPQYPHGGARPAEV